MKLLTMLLAGTVAFGTAAAPLTAMAATSGSYSITQPGTVNATKNVAYKISGVTKKQYAVVRVRGAAKTEVTVSKGSKNITSAVRSKSGYKMKGTGSTLSFKIKAKKTAVNKKYKVNVKIYNSASKKLVKKVSATTKVLVAATSVSLDSTTLSLKEGESKTLSYTLKPATSTDSVTYTSTNKTVAEVDNTGKVTAVAAGSATITATTTSGKTAICTVNVTAAQTPDDPSKPDAPANPDDPSKPDDPDVVVGEAANITAGISNQLASYENTVLSTSNAEVTVKVTDKDGNPVADEYVVLTVDAEKRAQVRCKTDEAVRTDSKGEATFVLYDVDSKTAVAAGYTVKTTGSDLMAAGTVKFATVSIGAADVPGSADKNSENFKKLEAGSNAVSAWGVNAGTYQTKTLEDGVFTEYVASQQVSAAGTKEHEVTLKVTPKINVPDDAVSDKVVTYVQKVGEEGTGGEYSTYAKQSRTILLDRDSDSVLTATLNFSSIRLSDYTKMTIEYFGEVDADGKVVKTSSRGSEQPLEGKTNIDGRGYQIPIGRGIKAVEIKIESAGQVDDDQNDGFVVDNVTYTYKESANANGKDDVLEGASVKWEVVTPTYTPDKDLTGAECAALDIEYDGTHTYKYKMPTYPYTGNAVITEYDNKNEVVAYYLAPTSNQLKEKTEAGYTYYNTNVITALDALIDDKYDDENGAGAYVSDNAGRQYRAYKASAEEVQVLADGFTVTEDGMAVKVNSEKSGMVSLKGTVSVEGMGAGELSGLNETIYTSVQFNPTPNTTVNGNEAFLALAGQDVLVTAQLVDKNGNWVSTKDQQITVAATTEEGTTVVSGSRTGTTDANGQMAVTFRAPKAGKILNLEATSGSSYDVVLKIGDKNAKKADIYWVEPNLSFTTSVLGDKVTVTTENDEKNVSAGIEPSAGSNWIYGVQVVADNLAGGKLDGCKLTVKGLPVDMTSDSANKGTYKATDNAGEMTATSKVAATDKISAALNSNIAGSTVTFSAEDANRNVTEFTSVGTGTPNLNAKLNLSVAWKTEGKTLSMSAPLGTNASFHVGTQGAGDGTKDVYVKVGDKYGNPIAGEEVALTVTNTAQMSVDAAYKTGATAATYTPGTAISTFKAAAGTWTTAQGDYTTLKEAFYKEGSTTATVQAYETAVTALFTDKTSEHYKTYAAAADTYNAAVKTYLAAVDTYSEAIVKAATATAADYAAATTSYNTANAAFVKATDDFQATVKTTLTAAGVDVTNAGAPKTTVDTFHVAATGGKATYTGTGGAGTPTELEGTDTAATTAANYIYLANGYEEANAGSGTKLTVSTGGWFTKDSYNTAIAANTDKTQNDLSAAGSLAAFTVPSSLTSKDTISITQYIAATGAVNTFLATVNNTTAGTGTVIKDAQTYSAAEAAYNTASADPAGLAGVIYAKTDADGYIKVTLDTPVAAPESTILTAKYDNQTQSVTINWTDQPALEVAEDASANPLIKVSNDLKSIEVTFNNRIYAENVTTGMFEVEETDKAGTGAVKKITGVSVNGRTVTIQFATALKDESTCTLKAIVDDKSIPGVDLILTDEYGYSVQSTDELDSTRSGVSFDVK